MSKRVSNKLNEILNGCKSCFNCINFKIKPFKFNELNKQINMDFKLITNTGRCVKELFNKNTNVKSSISSKTNKPVILRDALKSISRYRKMAETCDKYEGDVLSIAKPKPIRKIGKLKYKLIKYLF